MGVLLSETPERFMSRRLLAECRTFVADERGRAAAAAGSHDDLVMAMAIGQAVRAASAGFPATMRTVSGTSSSQPESPAGERRSDADAGIVQGIVGAATQMQTQRRPDLAGKLAARIDTDLPGDEEQPRIGRHLGAQAVLAGEGNGLRIVELDRHVGLSHV